MPRWLGNMVQRDYADLAQKVHTANLLETLPVDGSVTKRTIKSRAYYYWVASSQNAEGKQRQRYIGPADDPEIQKRVEAFQYDKQTYRERRQLVRMLRNMGVPGPAREDGEILNALAYAGFFRLRGVLIGSIAYQTYSGILGVEIPEDTLKTGDADLAQFHSISVAIDDQMPNVLEELRKMDPSFRAVPHHSDPRTVTTLVNADGKKLDFLTPNYSKDEYRDNPPNMPALAGMSAEPIRHLDFLIYQPTSAVLLHRAGVAVNVPRPERYAVHKLIVGPERLGGGGDGEKAAKDIQQAGHLIEAMQAWRKFELGEAWMEAWDRGPSWQRKLKRGYEMLNQERRQMLAGSIEEACADYGEDPTKYGAAEGGPSPEDGDDDAEPPTPGLGG